MFLLIQATALQAANIQASLHSNMFLLIQLTVHIIILLFLIFTFQYVSINTKKVMTLQFLHFSLHSNMFLLIPCEVFS